MADPVALKRGPGRPPSNPAPKAPEPCPECFPGGWKAAGKDACSLGCPHGTYVRE